MAYRALSPLLQGNRPPVDAGELIPDTYTDLGGSEQPNDFERLLEIGAAEKVDEPKPARRRTVKED